MTDAPDPSADTLDDFIANMWALNLNDGHLEEIEEKLRTLSAENARLRAEIAAAERKGAEEMRQAAKAVTDRWLAAFGDHEIHFTSAREYACAAITDATELIAALPLPDQPKGGGDE